MPALQVRDFPATLYDELKECAARNHRSIAQQTIIAVEEMLSEASAPSSARAGRGYRKIPNVRLPAERATSSLLRSKGGWSVCAKAARHERHGRGSASSFSKSAMRYLGKVVAFQRKISSRWFARDATGFRIAIGMRWIRSARRRNQRRR